MASTSKSVERLMITIEPEEALKEDEIMSYNAFSQVLSGVVVKGDLSSYIDCKIEYLGNLHIYTQLKSLCDKNRKIETKYARVFEKGFHIATYFVEDFEDEHIRIILSQVHRENMYLERTHTITKEFIRVVKSYFSTGEIPMLRQISKDTIFKLTGSTSDKCAFSINNIRDLVVKLSAMVIGYWVFYSSRLNSVPSIAIHTAHRMIVDNANYDICEAIRS